MTLPEIHVENGVRDYIDPSVAMSHEGSYGLLEAYWHSQGFAPPKLSTIMEAAGISREEVQEPSTGNRLMIAPMSRYFEAHRQNGLWLPHEGSVLTKLVTAPSPDKQVKGEPRELDGRVSVPNSYRLGFKSPDGKVVSKSQLGKALLSSGLAVKKNGVVWTINPSMDTSPDPPKVVSDQAGNIFAEMVNVTSTVEMHLAVKALHLIAGVKKPGVNDPLDCEIVNLAICKTEHRNLEPVYVGTVSWTPSIKDKDIALSKREARVSGSSFVTR